MKVWRRIISVLEIIGGVSGIGFMGWVLLTNPANIFTVILAGVAIAIYILSLTAGVALWKGSAFGRTASIIVQIIQLPKIMSPAIIFAFSFGLDLWIHYLRAGGFSTLGFEFRVLAFNQLFFNVSDAPAGFGISVISCVFLMVLFRYKPQARAEEVLSPPSPPVEWNDDSRT